MENDFSNSYLFENTEIIPWILDMNHFVFSLRKLFLNIKQFILYNFNYFFIYYIRLYKKHFI